MHMMGGGMMLGGAGQLITKSININSKNQTKLNQNRFFSFDQFYLLIVRPRNAIGTRKQPIKRDKFSSGQFNSINVQMLITAKQYKIWRK